MSRYGCANPAEWKTNHSRLTILIHEEDGGEIEDLRPSGRRRATIKAHQGAINRAPTPLSPLQERYFPRKHGEPRLTLKQIVKSVNLSPRLALYGLHRQRQVTFHRVTMPQTLR